jgi:hypothetical protein
MILDSKVSNVKMHPAIYNNLLSIKLNLFFNLDISMTKVQQFRTKCIVLIHKAHMLSLSQESILKIINH